MTPAARFAATIDILDRIQTGIAAEKALTGWARQSRFAGSKDRAAVRDHVFDALRCKRSLAIRGGGETGRAIVLGMLRERGIDPDTVFTGEGYAPVCLTTDEQDQGEAPQGNAALDCPDWLEPLLRRSLDDDFEPVCRVLQHRAPVFLRVNLARTTRQAAIDLLASGDIDTLPCDLSPSALEVVKNPRRVQQSEAYLQGLVELQDAASQAVVDMLPLSADGRVLDYCAGGGGKVLAMAGRVPVRYFAYDVNAARLKDLPARAERAGARVTLLDETDLATGEAYDLVLCDAPCSGSGAWRRSPGGKWDMTPERLTELNAVQAEILERAAGLVARDGVLAYATCSLLDGENMQQVEGFVSNHPDWHITGTRRFTPLDGGDGFFAALLTRK
jgi:16S rRNA (cytosine967-C5)-methyltransferase